MTEHLLTVADIDVSDDIEGAMLPGPAHPVKCLVDGTRYIQEVIQSSLALRVDEASSSITYIGRALAGTPTSVMGWQIQRIDTTTGIAIEFADGDMQFDNVWDDRAALSYS